MNRLSRRRPATPPILECLISRTQYTEYDINPGAAINLGGPLGACDNLQATSFPITLKSFNSARVTAYIVTFSTQLSFPAIDLK